MFRKPRQKVLVMTSATYNRNYGTILWNLMFMYACTYDEKLICNCKHTRVTI